MTQSTIHPTDANQHPTTQPPPLEYTIGGTVAKLLTLNLKENLNIIAQPGAVHSYSENIKFSVRSGPKWHRRIFGGEDAFQLLISADKGPGTIHLTSGHTGDLVVIDHTECPDIIARAGAFFAAQESVHLDLYVMKNVRKGLFGGGFTRLRLSGNGLSFCEARGNVTEVDLPPGETIYVDPEFLLAHRDNTEFEMTKGKRSLATRVLSKEGLYMAKFTGPGKIWLDNLPEPKDGGWLDWLFDWFN
jgi:uncharacterized protein (AIM24 family)